MKVNYASVALSAGVALGLSVACSARAESTAQQGPASQDSLPLEQVRIAQATYDLENVFRDQFVRGKIDRSALSLPIGAVLQAMPESARPRVQAHIDEIVQAGARLASEMSPAEREKASAPPSAEQVGKTEQAQLAAWGWPGYAGWGGLGAFAFPTSYWGGSACGWGYGACGYGLGLGGSYW